MSLTVVVVRDVDDRYRGFLASTMLEVSPGVFTSPRLSRRVREQVWDVLSGWYAHLQRGSIVMTWVDRDAPGGQGLRHLGEPARHLVEADGMLLVKRETTLRPAN